MGIGRGKPDVRFPHAPRRDRPTPGLENDPLRHARVCRQAVVRPDWQLVQGRAPGSGRSRQRKKAETSSRSCGDQTIKIYPGMISRTGSGPMARTRLPALDPDLEFQHACACRQLGRKRFRFSPDAASARPTLHAEWRLNWPTATKHVPASIALEAGFAPRRNAHPRCSWAALKGIPES